VEVEAARRRRCRITVSESGDAGFQATFVLRARADDLLADLGRRRSSLDRAAEVIAAVEDGEWWRDPLVFDSLGPSRARSIGGVRCLGGNWGTRRIKPTRRTRVLDFGPGGVSLRGWRTPVVVPWVSIADIEVSDVRPPSGAAHARGLDRSIGAVIVLKCHSEEKLAFRTTVSTPSEVRAHLSTLTDCLVAASEDDARRSSAALMAVGPIAVPELLPG
jgi:hypothetical protein